VRQVLIDTDRVSNIGVRCNRRIGVVAVIPCDIRAQGRLVWLRKSLDQLLRGRAEQCRRNLVALEWLTAEDARRDLRRRSWIKNLVIQNRLTCAWIEQNVVLVRGTGGWRRIAGHRGRCRPEDIAEVSAALCRRWKCGH